MAPGERRIAGAFIVSTLGALGLAAVYVSGGQPQLEGALLAVSLGGLGVGLILWAKYLLPAAPVVGDRETLGSSRAERAAFEASFERGDVAFERRTFLSRMLLGAVGALGLALLFPIRSLGPSPGRTLQTTAWAPGKRLMREDGSLVRVDDLEVGGIVTAFPEDRPDAADSQIVVVRVRPDQIRPLPGREDWSPAGNIAYSKICTHVGCPVGLYRETTHSLLCPCHQSTFDVLAARSDFTEPVGPGYWNRG